LKPLENACFRSSLRKARLLIIGIHSVFPGLKFDPGAEIERKGMFLQVSICQLICKRRAGFHSSECQYALPERLLAHEHLSYKLDVHMLVADGYTIVKELSVLNDEMVLCAVKHGVALINKS